MSSGTQLSGVARGGGLNLIGAVVWGASNFLLLAVLTRQLGASDAGVVILGIAIFNIVTTIAGLGSSSGLVRHISRFRATGEVHRTPTLLVVALVPVVVVGSLAATAVFLLAPAVAGLFGSSADGSTAAQVESTLRAMAPFMPIGAVYWVVSQGTRGFDTMRPVVLIDKIGRGTLLPVVVLVAVNAGLSPAGVASVWAGTTAVALVPAALVMRALVRSTIAGAPPSLDEPPSLRSTASEYWRFTGPRAVGQVSEVTVNWLDTVIVGSLLGAAAAGIYGAGTRYVLPGIFVADAIMQVVGPRISGMLSRGEHGEAKRMLVVTTGWQVGVLWPIYILVIAFAPSLLRVFGDEVVAATGALRWLAVGVLISSLAGPAASVILMSGRSVQAMFNTVVLVVVNVVGNLTLVPHFGLAAAGAVWGFTLMLASYLPAVQAHRGLDLATFGHPARLAALLAAVAFVPAAGGSVLLLGQGWIALAAGGATGAALYSAVILRWGGALELGVLRSAATNDAAKAGTTR